MRPFVPGLIVPILLLATALASWPPTAAAQEDSYYQVSGVVVSDQGKPLGGARIGAHPVYSADDHGMPRPMKPWSADGTSAIADSDGRFTLKLPAGRAYVNAYYEKWQRGEGREVEVNGPIDDLKLVLQTPPPRTAIIKGIVVAPDGTPIEGAQVNLGYRCCDVQPAIQPAAPEAATAPGEPAQSKEIPTESRIASYTYHHYHNDHQSAVTGPDGRFEFEAYDGPRTITAWAKGFAQTTEEFDAAPNQTTEVTVKLVKTPARDATLTGRVVDAKTGLPVANAFVNVRSLEWSRWADSRTGADGVYRIETVPGWTEISVHVWQDYAPMMETDGDVASLSLVRAPDTQYHQYTTVIKLASGETDHEITLQPKARPTIALIGYVVDPDSKTAVAGARVHVWSGNGDWGEAITDATGSYKILVHPGHHVANAWKDGYLGGSQSFVVPEGATHRFDILMPKGVQRWSPCYDDSDCGYVTHARGEVAYSETDASEAPPPMAPKDASYGPTAAPAPAMTGDSRSASLSSFSRGGSGSQYEGTGGGLPAYEPAEAPAAQEPTGGSSPDKNVGKAAETAAEVPGFGLAALAGVLALAAIALRRRG